MEQKSIWKNFLLLTVSSILALHLTTAGAADTSDKSQTSSDATDECVLEQE
jgi:hypothetical protein